MFEKLDHANDDIIFVNEDSNYVTFFSADIGIFSVDLNNINLADFNFDEDDPETIIHVRFLAWRNKFEKRKAYKKDLSKELMPLLWHPIRW